MSERVKFTSRNGDSVVGALAVPAGNATAGAVILLQEYWGLTPQIEGMADRLAAAGFVVLAPDLYRGETAPLSDPGKAQRLMGSLDGARALADIGGALDYLKAHPRGNGKVGVIGFCMGGAYSLAAAVHVRGLAAVVPFYGVPPAQDWSKIDAPVQAHFCATDAWAKPEIAEAIKRTLAEHGKPMELHVYPAQHAFMNEARPEVHDPAAAALAWDRAVGFLRGHLSYVAKIPGAGFERGKRLVGLVGGPAIALLLYLITRDGPAPRLAALMGLAVTWWLTEALPAAVVALLVAALAVLAGVAAPKTAFAAFGSPLLFMFVGSFFIAEAMKVHGLGERAGAFAARHARGPATLLGALAATTFGLSAFMSNAAATAIILPIALAAAVAAEPASGGRRDFPAAMVLAIAWGASMGGLATPVGTPPNLIGLRELTARGEPVDFATWAAIGLPIGLVMLAVMWLLLLALFGRGRPDGGWTPAPAAARPWSRGERAATAALAVAIVGWLLPSVLHLAAPGGAADRWAGEHVSEEVVAILASALLFVLPGGTPGTPRPALTWTEAARIDWGVILLFGGGILLGDLARQTGLTAAWGAELADLTGAHSPWAIVALVTAVSILLSEATSNTATATLMVPLAAGMVPPGASVVPAVLGATIGASFGFMMPISTAPNAMAYGTGKVTMGQMMRAGIVFDLIGFIVVVGGLRLLCPLVGLT